jgi:hypothetical protein
LRLEEKLKLITDFVPKSECQCLTNYITYNVRFPYNGLSKIVSNLQVGCRKDFYSTASPSMDTYRKSSIVGTLEQSAESPSDLEAPPFEAHEQHKAALGLRHKDSFRLDQYRWMAETWC